MSSRKAGPPKGYRKPTGMDGWEAREHADEFGYSNDPRWKQVDKLRKMGKGAEANGLVATIRSDWGVD